MRSLWHRCLRTEHFTFVLTPALASFLRRPAFQLSSIFSYTAGRVQAGDIIQDYDNASPMYIVRFDSSTWAARLGFIIPLFSVFSVVCTISAFRNGGRDGIIGA
jgi:hypothetical protein